MTRTITRREIEASARRRIAELMQLAEVSADEAGRFARIGDQHNAQISTRCAESFSDQAQRVWRQAFAA